VDPDERVEVSVILKPRRPLGDVHEQPLTREEYTAQYGASPDDLAAVAAFARKHGLEVVESSPPRRTVRLGGRAADVAGAFGVSLVQRRAEDGSVYRTPTGDIRLPPELKDIVQGVFGLDTRPIARHHR
jgi:kumamolisin